MNNVMVDLETLGTCPGASILSIGAVAFDHQTVGNSFYVVIGRQSCADVGLFEDPDTLKWWDRQSDAARSVLIEANGLACSTLDGALMSFNHFLMRHGGKSCKLWGNGSDFDNTILLAAYRAAKMPLGWGLYNNRCYRTIKQLRKDIKIKRGDTVHHNALDDARNQAVHMIEIVRTSPALLPLLA